MKTIDKETALNIAHGACLLGSGGGGGLDTATHMIGAEMDDTDTVPLVTVEEASSNQDKLSCVVLFGGSPKSAGRVSSAPAMHALEEMNEHCLARYKKPIGYVVPLEVGAVNTIVPILVAKALKLSVIDADGAGRAVPELTHCTYALVDELSINPTVMAARDGHTVTLKFVKYQRMKSIFSVVIATEPFARIGGMAIWPIPGRLLQQALPIRGTLGTCARLGKALRSGDPKARVPNAIAELEKAGRRTVELCRGTIRFELGGSEMYDVGQVIIESDEDHVHVIVQNENLIAWSDQRERVLGMMPDSLCYVMEDGTPFSNAAANEVTGERVRLLGVGAVPELLKPDLLRAYRQTLLQCGYGGPFVPVCSPS